MNKIINCPYCLQKISIGSEVAQPTKLRCPKCKLVFEHTVQGEKRIDSELRRSSINSSIEILASHY